MLIAVPVDSALRLTVASGGEQAASPRAAASSAGEKLLVKLRTQAEDTKRMRGRKEPGAGRLRPREGDYLRIAYQRF